MNRILTLLVWLLLLIIFSVIPYKKANKRSIEYVLILLLFYIIVLICLLFPISNIIENYNWIGKIQAFVASCIFVLIYRKISCEEYKITTRQLPASIKKSICLLVGLCIYEIILGIVVLFVLKINQQQQANNASVLETLLFSASMPGIQEEIAFRGIMLTLLNRVYIKKFSVFGIKFGWGLIVVTISFGIIHSVFVMSNSRFELIPTNFIFTSLIGFVLGLLAENSGSLAFPIFAHNIVNIFVDIFNLIK
jgi:uncharacterized protein